MRIQLPNVNHTFSGVGMKRLSGKHTPPKNDYFLDGGKPLAKTIKAKGLEELTPKLSGLSIKKGNIKFNL